jgi:hypothetical protein
MSARYFVAIFVGSALLFLVEPMCAKMVLPLLGGTPAVWNTCMVFFQAGLLLGYAYAHFLPNRLGLGRQAMLHVLLLASAAWLLPITLPESIPAGWQPVLWLLLALTWAVGLPFMLLAASAPLLQRWYAQGDRAQLRDPYFLYAASNLGSFTGLLSYPLLIEPGLSLDGQRWLWLAGYLTLLILTTFCLPWNASRTNTVGPALAQAPAPTLPRRLRWVLLATIPSSLMLSVTTHLTTDIAPVPLLWVIPVALYLLTFVLAFAGRQIIPSEIVRRWVPLAVLVAIVVRLLEASDPLPVVLLVLLLVFFWLALACHGELAQDRPPPQRLTDFYLAIAVGGALGGVFNGLVAPAVFNRLTEYPLMLILAALVCGLPTLSPPSRTDWQWALFLGGVTLTLIGLVQTARLVPAAAGQLSVAAVFAVPLVLAYAGHARPWRFAMALSAILLASTFYHGVFGTPVYRERSYFGVHLVADSDGLRRLVHGGTVHGMESLQADEKGIPLTYYHPSGPIGRVMQALAGDPRLDRVGLVGLGAGSLAYYSAAGQEWTFYEIDPTVIHIARNPSLFTYLREARGRIEIVEGDGRLQLQASSDRYGLLVLDAFGSDAIPLHLLTRQALELYLERLQPHGLIALHISNRYLDLEPVLANLAYSFTPELVCVVDSDATLTDQERAVGKFASVWMLLAQHADDLPAALRRAPWRRAQPRTALREWTDDYSNLWQVFRWQGTPEP